MSRKLAWTRAAWADYVQWQGQDRKTLRRINRLIVDTARSPSQGIGKPEALKENLTGFWSRRIDEPNRLVYAVDDTHITIISCRYHYQGSGARYGEIKTDLQRRGQVIGPNDLHIAAHARSEALTLVTNNQREFDRVDGLRTARWV